MTDHYHPPLRGGTDCYVCESRIKDGDIIASVGTGAQGFLPAHITCTKDGVERWLRENRPMADPLTWMRTARPTWSGQDAHRQPYEADTRCGYARASRWDCYDASV